MGRVTEYIHRNVYSVWYLIMHSKYLSQSQSHHLTNTVAHTEAATVSCAAAILQPYTCLITRSECALNCLLRKDEVGLPTYVGDTDSLHPCSDDTAR